MAIVHKHNGKTRIPVLHAFTSNSIRLEPGTIHESIELYKLNDNNTIGEKIEDYEYDPESRVLFIPNYQFRYKTVVKYDREDCLKW